MTESGLGRAGNDSSTAPFKGLPREIGDGHRLSQIFKKRATREAQRTVYSERILDEFALMIE